MAFLQDQTVIHIKLTDKGRELLSRGELTFKKFAIGDSEIDYEFNTNANLSAENATILRPYDNNPDIVSFIPEDVDGDIYTSLHSIANTTTVVTNTIAQKGMFNATGATAIQYSDTAHVKQAHMQVAGATVDGSYELGLSKTGSYVNGSPEPIVGDYVLVKWASPYATTSTVGFNVDSNVPYVFYKITGITGTLASNSLVAGVDRRIPNFSGVAAPYNSGAVLYPNNNGRKFSGDSILNYYGAPFVTDFVSESMIAFLENYDTPTIDVPVWNMTIVFTEDVVGIDPSTYRDIGGNTSVEFGGIVQYLQKVDPTYVNLGLIHYSNLSPSNNYGEGLVGDATSTPILDLPTIMWHKNTGATIGITLTGDYASIGSLPELNTSYMNLVDQFGNVVGKVFMDLKLFIIEDQELLFAMSYKSNRSWTLPPVNAGFNASLCPDSDVEVTNVTITP